VDEETTVADATVGLDEGAGPRTIGRHLVIERIGAGAMGVVYAAFDPQLSRKLAIKVLRGGGGADGDTERAQQRLVREAQALARLSHPNVVQIYDVGTHAGQVYVAMEFVEGQTLRQWLKRQPRPTWREILATLVPAARGLAAAHRADLVHRDVKPDNVLITVDGDARVVDFGLARAASGEVSVDATTGSDASVPAPVEPAPGLAEDSSTDSLEQHMTRTGAVLGTPAYMAPEQWAGAATDARSDQFSFCVVAWESLYGQRPFSAPSLPMLGVKIVKGQIDPPPPGSRVPPWLRRELERGLAAEPEARHPSMGALLDALTRDPGRGRRRAAYGAAGVVVVAASVWVGGRAGDVGEVDPCASAATALEGVWDLTRRRVVASALQRAPGPWAEDVAIGVPARLDTWATEWTAARREACAATMVRGEQSSELMDLRIACLDRDRIALRAVVDVLAEADAEVAKGAPRAVAGLPSLAECADVTRLRQRVVDPTDPDLRATVDEVRAQLARVRALHDAGRFDAAAEELEPLLVRTRDVAWEPLVAEVALTSGELAARRGQLETGESELRRSYLAAVASRHDTIAFSAAVGLVDVIGDAGGRTEEARREWEQARAELRRSGLGPQSAARLHNARFRLEVSVGEVEAAREHIEASIALRDEANQGDDVDMAAALGNLGSLQGMLGEIDTAVSNLQRAVAIRERVQGTHHPDLGRELHNLGSLYAGTGDFERAKPALERGLQIKLGANGPDHPDVAYSHVALGNVAAEAEEWDDAEAHQLEAVRILEQAHGPDHHDLRYPLLALGDQYLAAGRPADAVAQFRRAVALCEAQFGPEHAETQAARQSLDEAMTAAP
jgi:tetratricopeptide (TPR) repeat protein